MKKFLWMTAAALLLNCTSVMAEDDAMYTVYDFGKDTLTVSGNTDSFKSLMTFIVLPENVSPNNISPEMINGNKYVTYELRNESDGSFDFELQMPTGTAGGKYKVYAYYGEKELVSEFSYVSSSEVADFVQKINNASVSEIADMLKKDGATVGVSDDCADYLSELAAMLKETKPARGFSAESFMEELNRSSALTLLKNGALVDDIMRNYGKSFGESAQSEISSMNDTVKRTFIEYVKSNNVSGSTQEFFYQSVMMSHVINANSYVDMSNKLVKYQSLTGLLGDLSKVTTNTYKKLFESSPKNFETLQSELESLLNSQSSSSGSGGSGGGGGAVSSGATSPGISTGTVATTSGNDASIGSVQNGAETVRQDYTDIGSHWCGEYVRHLSEKGIISGYDDGTFKPDKAVTRAEFTKLVVSALGFKIEGDCDFSDVSKDSWYYGYISTGVKNGLVNGYENQFKAEELILRQEAAAIIFRAIGTGEAGDLTSLSYKDAADIADYAQEAVAVLTEKGLLSGDGEYFSPRKSTTRAEAAAMIYRLLNYIEN